MRVFLPDPQAAPGNDAQASPLRITWFKDLVHNGEGSLIALGKDASRIGVIDPCLLLSDLKNEHADGSQDVERLESSHGYGDMILFGQEVPDLCSNDRGYMAGSHDAGKLDLARVEDGPHGGWGEFMEREYEEIPYPQLSGLKNGSGHSGRRRFETNRQEDDGRIRHFFRQGYGIPRRIDDPNICPICPGLLETSLAPRDLDHIAEGGKDDPRKSCQRHGMVETPGRSDAYRASRARGHREGFRKQRSNPKPENGVRVPSAEFHEPEGLFQVLPDLRDQRTGQMGVSKFIDIFHHTATRNNILTAGALRTRRNLPFVWRREAAK